MNMHCANTRCAYNDHKLCKAVLDHAINCSLRECSRMSCVFNYNKHCQASPDEVMKCHVFLNKKSVSDTTFDVVLRKLKRKNQYNTFTNLTQICEPVSFTGHFSKEKEINHYHFKGLPDFNIIANDCIENKKVAFVAISSICTYFGITKQFDNVKLLTDEIFPNYRAVQTYNNPFNVFISPKKDTNKIIAKMQQVPKLLKKQLRKEKKLALKIKEETKNIKTKVITF